jgi:hypothetical protein
MMSNKSIMVLASKYRLKEPISVKDGSFNEKGSKEFLSKKLVNRDWAEDRNSHPNNELYVFHEEETEELMELREQNILDNAEKERRANVSQADLIDAIAGRTKSEPKPKATKKKVVKEEPKEEPKEEKTEETKEDKSPGVDSSLEELKLFCKSKGIKHHHKAGKGKLLELINKEQA